MLYTKHQYDTSDRIASQSGQIGDEAFTESYTYREEDGNIESMSIGDETIQYTYNGLQQPKKQITKNLDVTYTYRAIDVPNKIVSNQIGVVEYINPETGLEVLPTVNYTYDSVGNISKIQSGSKTAQYAYDDQNQLTQEILPSQTSDYGYDTYGNIRSKTVTDSQGETETYTFTYGNENWLDQLTEVSYTNKNGTTTTLGLTYDAIGNPTSYFNGTSNWTFTWKYGRELATAEKGSTNISYTYNENGIRESKTVGGIRHDYITLDDKVIRENYGNTTIDYFYDAQGRAYKIVAKAGSTSYVGYFVLNQQGDTIALLDENGTVVVTYEYDAWGKEINHTSFGTLGSKLYQYNALKYRGYYYDAESGFYYLQSRYYDSEIGRFLNPDIYISTGQSVLGNNMYMYCLNNPVNMIDSDGEMAKELAVWTGTMWWLPAIDGVLPIGDIIFAVTTAGLAIALVWTGRKYIKVSNEAAKAHKKIKVTVRRNSKVRYWSATVRAGYVDIGRPLTYSQAVKEVKAGRSVFTVTRYEAKAMALEAGGKTGKNNKSLQPEIDKGKNNVPGYYWHYHTYNRRGGHVYYLF